MSNYDPTNNIEGGVCVCVQGFIVGKSQPLMDIFYVEKLKIRASARAENNWVLNCERINIVDNFIKVADLKCKTFIKNQVLVENFLRNNNEREKYTCIKN